VAGVTVAGAWALPFVCLVLFAPAGSRPQSHHGAAETPTRPPSGRVAQVAPSDLGHIDFPTSGSFAAQAHFVRAVAWLHSFGYDQALEEFREAERLDPGFALAFWGEAMTHFRPIWYAHDVEAGRAALAQLGPTSEIRGAKASTARERAYMNAVETLFGSGDVRAQVTGFAAAMETLAANNPADDEAACFHALGLFGRVQILGDDPQLLMRAAAIAERVFARNALHPGAAHLIIHAYDDRDHAARALPAARAYAGVAPASSHARHMPSHIFLQLGMWKEAAASDEAAFAVTDAWVRRTGRSLADRDYHPQTWLVYEYLQLGRFADAKRALKPFQESITQERNPSLENELATLRAYYIIESGRWTEAASQRAFANIDELFAIAFSAVKRRDLDRAEAARVVFEKIAASDQNTDRREMGAIMERQIAGLIAIADGHQNEGVTALRTAVELEGRLPRPVGRPHPIKPSPELLGEILLDLGRAREARTYFDQALWRAANRSRSVLGLARAASQLGETSDAQRYYRQFLANWQKADAGLAELKEARAYKPVPR
jgi:tetratricopeptide (TPR) repeat protein